MCYGCYEELGSPAIVNDRTRHAAALVDKIYEDAPAGGNAHIVVDDWNLGDSSIHYCLDEALSRPDSDDSELTKANQRAALEALLALTMDERASAMAIHERWIRS